MAAPKAAGTAGGSPKHTLNLVFTKAERPDVPARIALTGPSGSGKTCTALKLATGMGTRIGVVDTERGRARHYSRQFDFLHLAMPDSAPQTLVRALAVAAAEQVDVIVLDGLTPYWSGPAGILQQVDATTAEAHSRNAFTTGWKGVKPVEQQMWDAILGYPGHVIATLRVKTAYEIKDTDGKKEPVKIGLKPDQRADFEYEFDIVGDLDKKHSMTVSKCSFPGVLEVNDKIELPDTDLGQKIVDWLREGERLPGVGDYEQIIRDPKTTPEQLRALYKGELAQRGLLGAALIDQDSGEPTTLGRLLIRFGSERQAAATQNTTVTGEQAATGVQEEANNAA